MGSSKKATGKKSMTAVYIFFGFLTLLFAFNVAITLPLEAPLNLARTGTSELREKRGRWYTLEEGAYSVGTSFGSIHIRSSFLLFHSNEYTYYCVTVNPGGEDAFDMPVRVKADKRQKLEKGEAVTLYGMASELTGDLRSRMKEATSGQSKQLSYLCLNDNGDTVITRCLSSAVFALFTAICIFLIVKLARR